jgi:hypothetical protein
VNCKIVECSNKVLAPRIICSCFSSRGASSEGSNQACGIRRTRIKGSNKVLASSYL